MWFRNKSFAGKFEGLRFRESGCRDERVVALTLGFRGMGTRVGDEGLGLKVYGLTIQL